MKSLSLRVTLTILLSLAFVAGCSNLESVTEDGAKLAGKAGSSQDKGEESTKEPTDKSAAGDESKSDSAGDTESSAVDRATAKAASIPEMPSELAVEPAAEVRTVKPGKPGFCDGSFEPIEKQTAESQPTLERYVKKPEFTRQDAARFACTFADDDNAREWVAAIEQQVVNEYGMSDWAFDEFMSYYLTRSTTQVDEEENELGDAKCPGYDLDGVDSPLEESEVDVYRTVFCNVLSGGQDAAVAWFYDYHVGEPDPLYRAAVLARLFRQADTEPDQLESDGATLIKFAMFRHDFEQVDEDEVYQALDELELTDLQRRYAAEDFSRAMMNLRRIKAAYEELAEEKAIFAELADDVPVQAYEDWHSEYDEHAKMVDEALSIEQAWLGEELDECDGTLRSEFQKFIDAKDVSNLQEFERVATSPLGFIAVASLNLCETAGEDDSAAALVELIDNSVKWRGPRTAAALATFKKAAAASDDLDFQPEMPFAPSGYRNTVYMTDRRWDYQSGLTSNRNHSAAAGVVKSVDVDGDTAKITFEQSTAQVAVLSCHEVTPRVIERIDSEGNVEYRRECEHKGSETIENTPDPVLVDARFAEAVKPGHYFVTNIDPNSDDRRSYPMEHFDSPNKDELITHFGFTLD